MSQSQLTLLDKDPPFPPSTATLRNFHATLFLLRDWIVFQDPFRKPPKGCSCDPSKVTESIPEITVLHASPLVYMARLVREMRTLRETWDELIREWDHNPTDFLMVRHNQMVCRAVEILNQANKTETDLKADSHSEEFRNRQRILDTLKEAREHGFPVMLMGPEGPVDPDKFLAEAEAEEEEDLLEDEETEE